MPDRFTADFKFYFRESVEGSEIRPVYSPPVEIFADGVSILPRQTEFQEVYVAQAVDMGRSAIYFHFPERITPACTSFDALCFYIAGFYVIEEKILFPGFPRLDMIYVLPMLSIVGYLYFIFFAIGCFPVQTDTINIDRLLQVDIEPFMSPVWLAQRVPSLRSVTSSGRPFSVEETTTGLFWAISVTCL